jgi:hypothetical protein
MLTMARTASAQPAGQQPTTTLFAPESYTVTPFAGIGFSGDLDSGTGVLGVAGGYVWSPRVSLEGEFTYLPSSENSGLVEVDTQVFSLTANMLYHFSGRAFVPYGVVGIGFGHSSVDVDDPALDSFDRSDTEFIVNFGGGVERLIRERLAFRGDLRYFFGGDLVPDYWRLSAGVSFLLGTP